MSIYFDYEVGASGRRFRRAVDGDKIDIEQFCNKEYTEPLFGEVDIGSLIELSALSICLINESKEVIGFMALSDHPPVPGVDPADWEFWIRNMFQRYYLSRNTLFIHYSCCIDSMASIFVEEALISVFQNDPYILFIVMVVPPTCTDEIIVRHRTRSMISSISKLDNPTYPNYYLLSAVRKDFCPRLRIRRAVEEDNDEVVELLHKKCETLAQLYGQFYISEIVAKRDPTSARQIIVAEERNHAVAVMCLNTDINYAKLHNAYSLKPYHGLKMSTPFEKEKAKRANKLLTMFGDPIMKGAFSQFDNPDKPPEKSTVPKTASKGIGSRVAFKNRYSKSEDSIIRSRSQSPPDNERDDDDPSPTSLFSMPSWQSVAFLLDEDSFEYDIVNIDASLLNIDIENTGSWFTLPKVSPSKLNQHYQDLNARRNSLRRHRQFLVRRLSKTARIKKKPSTIYSGQNNAFMIELFAHREDIDERCAYDLLEAAFELTKDYEYCIIRVPCEERGLNLLQHFTLVPTKPNVVSKHSLYVAHRSSVLGKLRVRFAELADVPGIAQFLQFADAKETIWNIEDIILDKQKNAAFVFKSGMTIIGIGIIGPLDQSDYLRMKYNIDSYQMHRYHYKGHGPDGGYGSIKCVIVYPAFEPHFRFFLRELMRLSGWTKLIWVTAYKNKWVINKANSLASAMIPLTPMRFEIDIKTYPEFEQCYNFAEPTISFSSWYINKKYTTIPKVNISTSIVIIGASRTAFGFLNKLLFCKTSTYLTFTNVTLISTNGVPYGRRSKPLEESMFYEHYAMKEKYLKSVPYTYYVNFVQGTLMDINLADKFVTLSSGARHYYDMLFLMIGIQYQLPNHMDHLLEREKAYQDGLIPEYIRFDDPRRSDEELGVLEDEGPENMFVINHLIEAKVALDFVRRFYRLRDNKIIVYGANIHTYLCIKTLLAINVPPRNIVFIEPFPSENPAKIRTSVFFNANVDEIVNQVVHQLGIEIYRSYYLQSWVVNANHHISQATFLSATHAIRIDCAAMFYYGKRGINTKAYVAIHRSGLAYDGGIVIDHESKTRDPNVYAAGPCTRYHRAYYAEDYRHKYYDSFEIGEKLGTIIRNRLDPLFKQTEDSSTYDPENKKALLVRLLELKSPKTICCVLPGGYNYLEVRAPGKRMPHHYVQSLSFNGFVMETFKQGYFKLHFTRDMVVDGVTCISKVVQSLEKFKYIYGHSASVLNNVHWRFTTKRLDNFFKFFQSPWAFFLYHDHAEELFAMAKQLYPKNQPTGLTLYEALEKLEIIYDNPPRIKFDAEPHLDAVTDLVMEWLVQHDTLLPVYLHPLKLSVFEQRTLPKLFIKKKYKIVDMLIN